LKVTIRSKRLNTIIVIPYEHFHFLIPASFLKLQTNLDL
jgi:hypothetical protein